MLGLIGRVLRHILDLDSVEANIAMYGTMWD